MSDHLFVDSNNITDPHKPFEHLSHWQYLKKRVQFWKYRLKHTLGRPVLIRWRKDKYGG